VTIKQNADMAEYGLADIAEPLQRSVTQKCILIFIAQQKCMYFAKKLSLSPQILLKSAVLIARVPAVPDGVPAVPDRVPAVPDRVPVVPDRVPAVPDRVPVVPDGVPALVPDAERQFRTVFRQFRTVFRQFRPTFRQFWACVGVYIFLFSYRRLIFFFLPCLLLLHFIVFLPCLVLSCLVISCLAILSACLVCLLCFLLAQRRICAGRSRHVAI
jgi:hypothetical protein